ncbi:hypothetical protein Tco_0797982 [Tanacetum coccineum]
MSKDKGSRSRSYNMKEQSLPLQSSRLRHKTEKAKAHKVISSPKIKNVPLGKNTRMSNEGDHYIRGDCKKVAFPVVENYVRNARKKYGIVCAMMNSKGLLFFKFYSVEENNKESDVVDKESKSEVEEVYNETASFMASKSGCGTGRKSLYERWKNDYDDNPYDVEECEDLANEQLAFCDAFDKSLCGHARC